MRTTGETLRAIRHAKGLTLQAVATTQLSVAFLSKVERDESDISLGRFENLLERLHTTYQEFSFLQHQLTLPPQVTFWRQVANYTLTANQYGLQQLYLREKDLASAPDSPHFHNMLILRCHLAQLQQRPLPPAAVKSLHDFLFMIPSWGGYELGLFTHAMFVFPTDQRVVLIHTALEKARIYLDLPGYHDLLATFFGNALRLFIVEHQYGIARQISYQAQQLLNFEQLSPEKSQVLFLTAYLDRKLSQETPLTTPEQILQACYTLQAPAWANYLAHQLRE